MLVLSVLLIVVFFLLSAFFSGMETGLISLDRLQLEHGARNNTTKKRILSFLENPDRLFGTTLFGTNISVVIVSSLGTYFYGAYINPKYISSHYWTLILATLLLIFAEIIPKAIYRENPNVVVPRYFPLIEICSVVLKPFVRFVELLNTSIAKTFRLPNQHSYHLLTREDISYMLSETEDDDSLHENQREMLEDVLEFSQLKAENVMIHRTEIEAFEKNTPISEVIRIAKEAGYTRFPVYDEDLDNMVGILIIYDILKRKDSDSLTAGDFTRKVYFAPETMDVSKLLTEMQTRRRSMAIIVDSFGGTAGLVTIEDILEEIVGEIEDEYDTATRDVELVEPNTYLIKGFVEIDFLNDEYDTNLPTGDYETIAGMIIDRLARIPAQNTRLVVNNWNLLVVQTTMNKIVSVKMWPVQTENVTPQN
ncbi:MAG: HlyC/CorC family transporter [Candidatus Cloacimonetes bacterium]|nr:HlyC/CorC family transporter [Candidatus Cloacimonadota bacterium]